MLDLDVIKIGGNVNDNFLRPPVLFISTIKLGKYIVYVVLENLQISLAESEALQLMFKNLMSSN